MCAWLIFYFSFKIKLPCEQEERTEENFGGWKLQKNLCWFELQTNSPQMRQKSLNHAFRYRWHEHEHEMCGSTWSTRNCDSICSLLLYFPPRQVNIDYNTKMDIQKNIAQPTKSCFEAAQMKVHGLMKKDSYPRFLHSDIYLRLTRKKGPGAPMSRRRSRSCVFNDRGEAISDPSAW